MLFDCFCFTNSIDSDCFCSNVSEWLLVHWITVPLPCSLFASALQMHQFANHWQLLDAFYRLVDTLRHCSIDSLVPLTHGPCRMLLLCKFEAARTIAPPHHWLNSLLKRCTIDSNRALFHWSWINLSLVASNPWFIDPQHHKFNWMLFHYFTFFTVPESLVHCLIQHRFACRLLLLSKIHCFRLLLLHRVWISG